MSAAASLYNLGRYKEALVAYAEHTDDEATAATALAMMSQCELSLGKRKEAQKTAESAVARNPDLSFAHYALALVLASRARLKMANAEMDVALKLDPYSARMLCGKARLASYQGDWQESLEWSKKALAANPDYAEAKKLYAEATVHVGTVEEALDVGAAVLHDNPDSADAHCANGMVYLRLGKPKDAARHFREALRLKPTSKAAERGMKEALKATFPLYRWLVQYRFWVSRRSKTVQGLSGVVFYAIVRGGVEVMKNFPHARPYLAVAVFPLGLLLWMSWFGSSLLTFLLSFHPFGKFLLDRNERLENKFMLAFFALGFAGLVLLVAGSERGVPLALVGLFGVILIAPLRFLSTHSGVRRALAWGLGCFMLLIGLFIAFAPTGTAGT